MTNSLVSLPSNLLDRILSYDDTSYLSLPLWLVGNKALHALLSESVTYVELRNSAALEYLRLPKYLTNLRSLRHLLIDRTRNEDYHVLYDPFRTLEVISGLPVTMESLVLRFHHSKDIFFPALASTDLHLSIASKFPELRTLHVDLSQDWTLDEIRLLPRSLTDVHLRVVEGPDNILQCLDSLPPEIESFVMSSDSVDPFLRPNFYERLPPHTREFSVHSPGLYGETSINPLHLAAMPRSLTRMNLTSEAYFPLPGRACIDRILPKGHNITRSICVLMWDDACAAVAPPFILGLSLHSLPEKGAEKALESLPQGLEKLFFHGVQLKPKHLRALPRGLYRLACSLKGSSRIKKDAFPPQLKKLEIALPDPSPKMLSFLSVLPPLLYLNISAIIPMRFVSVLPRTLTSMEITFSDVDETIVFPPNLVYITTHSFNLTLYENSKGRATPELMKVEKKHKKKMSPPAKGDSPSDGCKALAIFPIWLLPRSTTYLWAENFHLPASRLPGLPPLLRTLKIDSIFLDSEFNPYNPAMISAARYFLKETGEHDSYDYVLDRSPEPQVTVFDLLPRSLTEFSSRVPSASPSAYSRLPQNLEILRLKSRDPGESADALFQIPMGRLKKLRFCAADLTDAHLEPIRHLQEIDLFHRNMKHSCTVEGLKKLRIHHPTQNFFLYRGDPTSMEAWSSFLNLALEAMQDPSGEALLTLLAKKGN